MEVRRLYKSRTDRMLDGVCAGLADYFGVSPVLVRLAFVIFAFFDLFSVVAYVAAMILVPAQSASDMTPEMQVKTESRLNLNHGFFWGGVLILIGGILLIETLDLFEFRWVWRHAWKYFIPVSLIAIGLMLILGRHRVRKLEESLHAPSEGPFHRVSAGKKIFGVCSGIAAHWNWDVALVRVLFVLLTFAAFPLGIVLYGLIALLTNDENAHRVYESNKQKSQEKES